MSAATDALLRAAEQVLLARHGGGTSRGDWAALVPNRALEFLEMAIAEVKSEQLQGPPEKEGG